MKPLIPEGATVRSILTAHYVAGIPATRRQWSCEQLLRGYGSAKIAGAAIRGEMSELEFTTKFSLAPFILCTRPKNLHSAILKEMLSATPPRLVSVAKFPISENVRRCPLCVQDDLAHGFAYSRVAHQVPVIKVCSKHHTSLEEICSVCNKPFSKNHDVSISAIQTHFISECRTCSSSVGVPLAKSISAGQTQISKLLEETLSTGANDMSPGTRFETISHASKVAESLRIDICSELADLWETESPEDAASQNFVPLKHIEDIFTKKHFRQSASAILCVMTLANSIIEKYDRDHAHRQHATVGNPDDPVAQRVARYAKEFSIPPAVIAKILSGIAPIQFGNRNGISVPSLNSFLESLSNEEKSLIDQARRDRISTPRHHLNGLPRGNNIENARASALRLKNRILAELESTAQIAVRPKFRALDRPLFVWLGKHDKEWLNKHFPARQYLRKRGP